MRHLCSEGSPQVALGSVLRLKARPCCHLLVTGKCLAGEEHTFSGAGSTHGPAVLQYKLCLTVTAFPVTSAYLSPSGEELPWKSLPSTCLCITVAVEMVHPHSILSCRFAWSHYAEKHAKMSISIFRDFFFFKCVFALIL